MATLKVNAGGEWLTQITFGVNEAVLQNKAYGADLDAFFNGAIA